MALLAALMRDATRRARARTHTSGDELHTLRPAPTVRAPTDLPRPAARDTPTTPPLAALAQARPTPRRWPWPERIDPRAGASRAHARRGGQRRGWRRRRRASPIPTRPSPRWWRGDGPPRQRGWGSRQGPKTAAWRRSHPEVRRWGAAWARGWSRRPRRPGRRLRAGAGQGAGQATLMLPPAACRSRQRPTTECDTRAM